MRTTDVYTVANGDSTPNHAANDDSATLGHDNDDGIGVVDSPPVELALDSAPESDFESEICAGEKGPQREHLAALGNMVRYAEALDAKGFDWSELTGVSLPPDIAALRVQIMFASGMFAKHWYEATISYGALVWLTQQRIAGPKDRIKDARGIVLSIANLDDEIPWMRRRRKEKCVAINGLSFDADGYPTREMVQPTCLLIAYSTSNDGKNSEKLSRDAYKGAPTPEAIRHHFGDEKARAYKNLRVGVNDDGLGLSFDKQQRTRYLAAFKRPLEGDLLDQLIERSLFDKFAAAVEEEALGITGTDTKCFEPVRVAYLGIEPQYDAPAYNEVIGPHELFDPVPTAERILAENPPRERKEYSGEIRDGEVPPHLRESLKGVLFASLIAERCEELVRNENNLDPLVLHRCPFADEHGSKTGVSDGSAYVYDAGEEYAYPRVKCHHETCKNRKTEEFVAAMIEAGEIEREDVFENADYRIQYDEKPNAAEVRVVDKNGDGLDCAKYVAKTGDDRTATELADQIKAGDVSVAGLIDTALAAEAPDADPYKRALRALAIESSSLMPTDVDDRVGELVRLHNKSGVRAVKGDLKHHIAAIEARKRELGLLSVKEAKKARAEDAKASPESEHVSSSKGRVPFVNWTKTPHTDVVNAAVGVLARRNAANPRLFDQGGEKVRVQKDQLNDTVKIVTVTQAMLRAEIAKVCDFMTVGGEDECRHYSPPKDVAEHAHSLEDIGLPTLEGISTTPFYDKDGNRVDDAGYHAPSRFYYAPPAGFSVPQVAGEPTGEEIEEAKATIRDVIGGFPFDDNDDSNGQSSEATFLAKLIQPFVRGMIDGPCPMYVTQKPKTRTGASKLNDVFSVIVTGAEARSRTLAADDLIEQDKVIVSALKAGASHISFDNIAKPVDSDKIAQLVSSRIYVGRDLGFSRDIIAPNNAVVDLIGNNIQLSDELRERALLINLNARCERPHERVHRIKDLIPYVKERRGVLVHAVLTLVQNWIAMGRPSYSGKALGGFESYCSVVGGILEAAGIQGFMANRVLLRGSTGDADGGFKHFVELWWKQFGEEHVAIGMLDKFAEPAHYEGDATAKDVETLADLLLKHVHDVSLDAFMQQATQQPKASFGSLPKTSWNRNLALTIKFANEQVFELEDGTKVVVKYGPVKGNNRARLVRLGSPS